MDDVQLLIIETARKIFEKHVTHDLLRATAPEPAFDAFWAEFEAAGLDRIMLDAELDAAGLAVGIGFGLIRLSAWYAAPGPIAETLLAGWIARQAGLPAPDGQMTLVLGGDDVRLERKNGEAFVVSGRAAAVPWGRSTTVLLVLERQATTAMALLPAGTGTCRHGCNVAGEPRDAIEWHEAAPGGVVMDSPATMTLRNLRALGASVRAAQMAGAAARICEMTVEHVQQRRQFGKTLASFQAIQQSLAQIATAAAASSVAADRAMQAFKAGDESWVAGAVGKIRAGEAAGLIAPLAHQLHGAIGYTQEYMLHWLTKRLWAWRDEFGSETHWAQSYGQRLIGAGADQLWPGFVHP